ncbi:hypothetical protein CAEBREN_32389 [Caenorhabditis brenneri]|uniref:Uncharacterized protein n=1 Tax=Caenorhabditis brenneri TaxID=135651 RepID=G0N2Q0_CAEBE|nr:hypothetical protein CAEBREN_32389 [Caenorhabditis brenneri]
MRTYIQQQDATLLFNTVLNMDPTATVRQLLKRTDVAARKCRPRIHYPYMRVNIYIFNNRNPILGKTRLPKRRRRVSSDYCSQDTTKTTNATKTTKTTKTTNATNATKTTNPPIATLLFYVSRQLKRAQRSESI